MQWPFRSSPTPPSRKPRPAAANSSTGARSSQGPPEHIDPALNSSSTRIRSSALYDGLTDIDATDPAEPGDRAAPAASYEIERGRLGVDVHDPGRPARSPTARRSCPARSCARGSGPRPSPVTTATCSTSSRAAASARTARPTTISGVVADDEAMTLTVTLSAPYAELRRGRRLPDVLPDARSRVARPRRATRTADGRQRPLHDRGGAHRRGDRARQERELGTATSTARRGPTRPDAIVFRISADADTSFTRWRPVRATIAIIPPAAPRRRRTTGAPRSRGLLGSYYFLFNDRDEIVGGEENLLLRQAISQAIDRDAINEAVFDGVAHHRRPASRRRASPVQGGHVRVLRVRPRGRPGGVRRVDAAGNSQADRSRSSSTTVAATRTSWRSSSRT